MKITGLDKLTQQLSEAQRAMQELDGDLGKVSFDPEDPASLEAAIVEMEAMVDRKMGPYASNPLVAPLIDAAKETFRTGLIDQAQSYRLGRKDD